MMMMIKKKKSVGDIKRRARTLTLATRFPDVINIFTCSFLFGDGDGIDARELKKEQQITTNLSNIKHNTQKHLIFGVTKNRCSGPSHHRWSIHVIDSINSSSCRIVLCVGIVLHASDKEAPRRKKFEFFKQRHPKVVTTTTTSTRQQGEEESAYNNNTRRNINTLVCARFYRKHPVSESSISVGDDKMRDLRQV